MQAESTKFSGWKQPLPLKAGEVPTWPTGIFLDPFEKFVNELARSTETPIELASLMMLAVIATAAHKKYVIQLKSDYFEPVNVWPVVILSPGNRKSRVFSELTKPLKDWESRQKEIMEPEVKRIGSRIKTIEARIKELRTRAAKVEEKQFGAIDEEIQRLEREMPEPLSYPQIWASDITTEQLGVVMAANNEAMAILSDEGGVFDILMGLYSDGKSNIDLFLQGHSGSSVRVDRGSRPPIFMDEPALTVGLTVQPQVVKSICKNKTFRGRGLLGRILFAIPNSNIGSRSFDEAPMDEECRELFHVAMKAILNQPGLSLENKPKRHVLKVCPEAYEKWKEYAKGIETLMSEEVEYLSHITDWAGKLPGAIGRIAALLHIMRHAFGAPYEHEVGLDDMNEAIKIGHALTRHALIVFDLVEEGGKIEMARKAYRWIKQGRFPEFTMRELTRKFRSWKKDEREAVIEVLEDHEIIRRKDGDTKIGRPSERFEVNPYMFEEQ